MPTKITDLLEFWSYVKSLVKADKPVTIDALEANNVRVKKWPKIDNQECASPATATVRYVHVRNHFIMLMPLLIFRIKVFLHYNFCNCLKRKVLSGFKKIPIS